jgi:hypothetical protein
MALKGKEKEQKQGNYSKHVGLFNAYVVAVNPTKEELSKLLNANIDRDLEYAGVNDQNGAKKLTVSFWLKEENEGHLFNVRFNLEDTVVVSKTGKTQFINTLGTTSYAEDASQVPDFLTQNGRMVRQAKKGEELLYKFLRNWLSHLNYEDESTELYVDWKKLMSGKTIELKEAIESFKNQTICSLATVRTADDGKEYQGVYSYEFLPSYALDCFTGKKNKNYKSVDKFIEKVGDADYGCKDYYELKPLKEYDPSNNIINRTNSPIVTPSSSKRSNQTASVTDAVDDLPF